MEQAIGTFYAKITSEGLCVGVSQLAAKITAEDMIEIDAYDEDYLWRKYENGKWSEEKYKPIPSMEEPELTDVDIILLALAELIEKTGVSLDSMPKAVKDKLDERLVAARRAEEAMRA